MQNKPTKRTTPSSVSGNCVTDEREEFATKGKLSAQKHSDWEKKQTFEVIRPDHKTTIYRRVKKGENTSGKIIHKGKI